MKPFLKWAGGKGKLISTLESYLPSQLMGNDDITYIEPFVGGGAMLFYMLQRFPNIRLAVINDINPDLVGVYRSVRDSVEELISALADMERDYFALPSVDAQQLFFYGVRDRYNSKRLSLIENSASFIFLNKTCFNGLYRVNSKGKFNVPFGKYKTPLICDHVNLRSDSKLLRNVEILCGDFEQTRDFISSTSFCYIDPPYRPLNATSCFNSYAKETFDDDEQTRLRDFVDELTMRGCSVLLSNSDCRASNPEDTFLDDLYSNYIIERVWAARAVNSNGAKRGKLTELLIRNYKNTSCIII